MSLTSTDAPAHVAHPVTLRGVRRTYPTPTGTRTVLAGVDLELAAGEIVALVGRSGFGKSTLLLMVSGLYAPDVGEILIDG